MRTQKTPHSIGFNSLPHEKIASSIDLLPWSEPVESTATGLLNRSSLLSRQAEIAPIRFSVSTWRFHNLFYYLLLRPTHFQIRVVRQIFVCARNALPSFAPNLRFSRHLSLFRIAHRVLYLSTLISILTLVSFRLAAKLPEQVHASLDAAIARDLVSSILRPREMASERALKALVCGSLSMVEFKS